MTQNTCTLLTKFFGLYCYKTSLGRNIRFVIMNNILPSNVKFDYLFDLKVRVGPFYPHILWKAATRFF
jgi:1-phosphatidylinositol-4-phosphate 5-kinase